MNVAARLETGTGGKKMPFILTIDNGQTEEVKRFSNLEEAFFAFDQAYKAGAFSVVLRFEKE
jgi:hypothetical protein